MLSLLSPSVDLWTEDKAELQRHCLHAAFRELENAGILVAGEVDPEEALAAIGMWKGALIAPERAGYRGHQIMPKLYQTFERIRIARRGVTFDDFVPMALEVLRSPDGRAGARTPYAHIIVDEYQDVNLGQQVLLETVAGPDAEVMVVGDDDQTIYEFRGARPDYILRSFPERFPSRATRTYTLTYSFRFGPVIAQCADNVISYNADRHPKAVVAHDGRRQSHVAVVEGGIGQSWDADAQPSAPRSFGFVMSIEPVDHDVRSRIAVLGRTFSQLAGL